MKITSPFYINGEKGDTFMGLTTKLNPPSIANKLPAFIYPKEGDSISIQIPYIPNRAVGVKQFDGMKLLIRTVQTNIQKAILDASSWTTFDEKERIYKAVFNLNFSQDFIPQKGQYYKVQLACIKDGVVGFYSNVGIIKCIPEPQIEIQGREDEKGSLNTRHSYEYTGIYKSEEDFTEKVYSYCFSLYNEKNELIDTSGELLHNSNTDQSSYMSSDVWATHKKLSQNQTYEIEYKVTTTNGYQLLRRYPVIEVETIEPNVHADVIAVADPADGYIAINLAGHNDGYLVNGSFILLRSSSEDGFDSWYELTNFYLLNWNSNTIKEICRDYTVQQGFEYEYAIQAYNNSGLYSNRMVSPRVACDFEDAFLYDGTRQLKIRFNPKITNFKSTVLETKTNTIGSKYPFIFRNGVVDFKEFSISGLVSLVGDENDEFKTGLPQEDLARRLSPAPEAYVPGADGWLTADNYRRERQFKLAVMDWLNDGKPKLFRSPAEGNYIVRLMGVTMAPNDQLGRMLHTFSCNATEVADYTFENLVSYGFTVDDYVETRSMKFEQRHSYDAVSSTNTNLLRDVNSFMLPSARWASISADPGFKFYYLLDDKKNKHAQEIGVTGAYIFPADILQSTPLLEICCEPGKTFGNDVTITYGWYDGVEDSFSYINNIKIYDRAAQLSGKGVYAYGVNGKPMMDEMYNHIYNKEANLITPLEDFRKKTGSIHYLKVALKTIVDITVTNVTSNGEVIGKQYWFDTSNKVESWNPTQLYRIADGTKTKFILGSNPPTKKDGYYNFDGVIDTKNGGYDDMFLFRLGEDSSIDMSGNIKSDGQYILTNLGPVRNIQAGIGILIDIIYQEKEIVYTIEITNDEVKNMKQTWLNAQEHYENLSKQLDEANKNNSLTTAEYNKLVQNVQNAKSAEKSAYNTYIKYLELYVNSLKEEYNIEYAI